MENKQDNKQNKPEGRQENRPQSVASSPAMKEKESFRYIVRIMNTDLDGKRKILDSIRKIKGIGFSFAHAVCTKAAIDWNKRIGDTSDEEIKRVEEVISKAASTFPHWMLNRRRNPDDATPKHLVTTDLTFSQENDIRQLKKMRCYRGVRHMAGAPVRGQRTRSNFRKNKGKVLGVVKAKPTAAKAK